VESKAWEAVEVMLRFLFEHKSDHAAWTSSDEYISFNSLLIKTGTDFDNHYKLFQPFRTYYSLKVLMDEVQEDFLAPAIGEDLLEYFINSEDLDDDEKKLLKLLKKAATYMVIKKACEHYSVRFDSNGFTIIASGDSENTETSGRTTSDISLFEMKMNSCEQDAGTYLAKAKKKLAEFRAAGSVNAFNIAYDTGPLVDYDATANVRDRKNDTRKLFRF